MYLQLPCKADTTLTNRKNLHLYCLVDWINFVTSYSTCHFQELYSWMKYTRSVVFQVCIIFEMLVVKEYSRYCVKTFIQKNWIAWNVGKIALLLNGTIDSQTVFLTCKNYHPPRDLRSSKKNLPVVPVFNTNSYGCRAFSVFSRLLWNSLPQHIRDAGSLDIFKRRLKTTLFIRFLDSWNVFGVL